MEEEEQQQPPSLALAFSISSSSSSFEEWINPSDAVIFFGLCLALGIACRHILRGTRVPYTVALLIIGVALGFIEYGTHLQLGKIGNGIRIWSEIDPELLLAVFLPALLFESAFSMEVHQIKRCIGQMILLAGPGVVISTAFLGAVLKLTFPYNWSWKMSLLLGGLLGASDPVAVVALLKELGADKKLTTIIDGESLMNDGVAVVIFTLFYQMVLGKTYDWVAIIKFLVQVSLGGVGIGLAFGIASVLWLGFIFNDTVIEISLTLAVSYVAYFTAQQCAAVSGILTVMALGMFYSAFARTAFKGESQKSLHHFWEMIAYIANTLIFILSGVVIAQGALSDDNVFYHGQSWFNLLLLYVYVQVARCIMVVLLYPFLRYFGYGLDWKEAIILIWSGLRGAVSLSLSLSVKRSSGRSLELTPETGTLFVFFTGGIVALTLIVNGSAAQYLLHFLGMAKLSAAKRRILDFTKFEMLSKALEAFDEFGDDEELGPTDWHTVKRYISCLNDIDGERADPYASESETLPESMKLKDIRVRLLNGVQAAYWEMLNEGRISQTTANILMLSVEEAIDLASHQPLCDWKGLKANVHFPNYYKFLQSSMFPTKLVTYFTVEKLESACYICAAFLRAHKIARKQLHDFLGDNDVASAVINESIAEGDEARKFLEDVRITYPEVLSVVKTRQATHVVLNHLIEYVQNLEKAGILEEKEMLHLHDAVQTDLKRLHRNPQLGKPPKISNIHHMLGALPSSIRESLTRSTREMMKLHGLTLYKEGSKSNGIWLISKGVVKWESKTIRNKHTFNPTLTHGSTLGLYEVLTGRPYICDVTTDSVVFCIFLEADKIVSWIASDPSLEDFLWKESAIFLCKLLLPQKFEKLAIHELRALIAERSRMNIYTRGESIEIPHHSVAFLLDGYVKTQFHQEQVTAPAILLPSHGNLSFQNLAISDSEEASFSHQGSSYLVESRARVIVINIAAFETESHAMDLSGLMSWPEHFHKQKHHNPTSDATGQQTMSTGALQLSIYENMDKNLSSNQAMPPHSSSCPTSLPHHGQSQGNVGVAPSQTTEGREQHGDEITVRIDSPKH